MAAKAYTKTQLEKYFEIKRLDNRYWASHCDILVYKKNIKTAKDFERYLILLNKLEHSDALATHFKEEISRMFRWSFV
jgi:phage tail tape-measure protein